MKLFADGFSIDAHPVDSSKVYGRLERQSVEHSSPLLQSDQKEFN